MKNITEKLKILCGRQLSEKEMEQAKEFNKNEIKSFNESFEGKPKDTRIFGKMSNGKYMKIHQDFIANSMSELNIFNQGYLNQDSRKIYNSKGQIEQQNIVQYIQDKGFYELQIDYNPAGNWFGKETVIRKPSEINVFG